GGGGGGGLGGWSVIREAKWGYLWLPLKVLFHLFLKIKINFACLRVISILSIKMQLALFK
ncbi:hypothetical protein ACJX0J_006537, partial [Zea mays]